MMAEPRFHVRAAMVAGVVLTLVYAGCARKPDVSRASAPAPAGVAALEAEGEGKAGVTPGRVAGQAEEAAGAAAGPAGAAAGTAAEAVSPGAVAVPGVSPAPGPEPAPGAVAAPGPREEAVGAAPGVSAAPSPQAEAPGAAEVAAQVEAAAAARPSLKEFAESPRLGPIYFDFDRYDIREEDARTLDLNAAWLQANPGSLLLIEGHCDERGTNEYNLALGTHRAQAARNYLVAHGIQGDRITTISYGEERPACTDRSEDCWAKNRRGHFLVKAR